LTIERLRTLVLLAGILLLAALGVFLAIGRYKSHFNLRELPKRLGVDIQQEADGVTYSHSLGGLAQYKVHASKVEQLKDGRVLLHEVWIELYGQDGKLVARIEGHEFNYDVSKSTAVSLGKAEITLMRPGVAPAIAPKALPQEVIAGKSIAKPLAMAAQAAAAGEIRVETSGLTSNWKTGITTTTEHVDFSMAQGTGSSTGATYNAQQEQIVLDRDVVLTTVRSGQSILIHAQHGDFTRGSMVCHLRAATASYRGGQATAGEATVLFRQDGSAVKLDAVNGFTAQSQSGSHIAAPTGTMEFDEHNQPQHGHLEGGVRMDSVTAGRQTHGSALTADLDFTSLGQLRHVHLEHNVEMNSQSDKLVAANPATGAPQATVHSTRTWRSPAADIDLREADNGQLEPESVHGTGGVVVTGETRRGSDAPAQSRMAADQVSGTFGPHSALTSISGTGHAAIDQTTNKGAVETATGDKLQVQFFPAGNAANSSQTAGEGPAATSIQAEQIQLATLEGHVTLSQTPAPKPDAKPGAKLPSTLHATAGRAVYEGAGQWLHLTLNPRADDGATQLSADKIDVSEQSGDAFAHGNVKGTWLDSAAGSANGSGAAGQQSISLGGQGPTHAIAQQAQIERASGNATFKGHARLWQLTNSVAAPVIVLNRDRKTLHADSTDPAEPVRVVLLGSSNAANAKSGSNAKSTTPSVIRVRGGSLTYSDVDRRALMLGGALGPVEAQTATADATASQVELFLLPAGDHGTQGEAGGSQGEVDRMIASGNVVVSSQGRRGVGQQLAYTSSTGEFVLTGTATAPPRMTDPNRGSVTGNALIFHTRDDSVSIEGGGGETRTGTTVRQKNGGSEPQK
jgi:lipopolysaccharide export system protein LptA